MANHAKILPYHPKKLIEQDNVRKYLLYAIGKILLVVIGNNCPVRDYLSVELMNAPQGIRAVRYEICRAMHSILNHIAYQPAVGHSLRHAGLWVLSFFYRYVVPTGQTPSVKN